MNKFIYKFSEIGIKDVALVGGKTASLGEMYAKLTPKGIQVPNGFAISAYAYDYFVTETGIKSQIENLLKGLDVSDIPALASCGNQIRTIINNAELPPSLVEEVISAYQELSREYKVEATDTAVRSSATAEDLPDASFAGQQESFLNICGTGNLLQSVRSCFASLFTDRAIAYREEKGFDHFIVKLSIAVQKMVRSDVGSSGVMFTLDTESGFKDVIYITGAYGLGENVVQGAVNPDEYYVRKEGIFEAEYPLIYKRVGEKQLRMIYGQGGDQPVVNTEVDPQDQQRYCLEDEDIIKLGRWAVLIEKHYSHVANRWSPMDIEWAKDGQSGELFIVQARPETVISQREQGVLRRITLERTSRVLAEGLAVGDRVGSGAANVILDTKDINSFVAGQVLITKKTDPDWVPIMKIASAIVTESGGRTSHAAIISRELDIPCIVGAEGAADVIQTGQAITASCVGGNKGIIYEGELPWKQETIRLSSLEMPEKVKLFIHQSEIERAFFDSLYPNAGVGLVRIDELIASQVRLHPRCVLEPEEVEDHPQSEQIKRLLNAYPQNPQDYVIDRIAYGIGMIATAAFPKPTRVLLSDGTSKSLSKLLGGDALTATEDNPFMGLRGLGLYTDLDYEDAFALELEAIKKALRMGVSNLEVILPAFYTVAERDKLLKLLSDASINLPVHALIRTPLSVLEIKELSTGLAGVLFDYTDLAQLLFGIDRHNILARAHYDEVHKAVLKLIATGLHSLQGSTLQKGLCNLPLPNLEQIMTHALSQWLDYLVIKPDSLALAREVILSLNKPPSKT